MVPNYLCCYDDMVIVTHAVYWFGSGCPNDPNAMKIIENLCDGRNSCHVEHNRNKLGGSCAEQLYFTMYYSCQTGKLRGKGLFS